MGLIFLIILGVFLGAIVLYLWLTEEYGYANFVLIWAIVVFILVTSPGDSRKADNVGDTPEASHVDISGGKGTPRGSYP
jgi:hypothetical protein